MLNPTPPERLVDPQGRPYFLWDVDITLEEFQRGLQDPIRVDTVHEILVNKLCALLSRSEIRDLEDVKALVGNGADLNKAIADAPRKDSGFSHLTLAWVLKGFQTRVLARAAGIEDQAERLEEFKQELMKLLLQTSAPSESP